MPIAHILQIQNHIVMWLFVTPYLRFCPPVLWVAPPSAQLFEAHTTPNAHRCKMRSSAVLFRGAKGYGWYQNYIKKGSEAFAKHTTPTPFDWAKGTIARPKVYFDVSIGSEAIGRLIFELAEDVVPKTVENFKLLTTGSNVHSKSFVRSKFHQVQKGSFIMGGDVENYDGTGSHSAYKDRYIEDENFIIPHSGRGLLSMASVGLDTGGSQFYVALAPCPHMNGRCVVFGRMDEKCEPVLSAIEKVYTFRGTPSTDVTITSCGVL